MPQPGRAQRRPRRQSEEIFSKNKLTLVNFFKNNCSACDAEMPELQRLNREYADKGFEVLGIACVDFSSEGTVLTVPVEVVFSEQSFAALEAYLNGTSAELPTETDASTDSDTQNWFIRVIDQNKDPVPDVFVNFCSDTACTPVELNEKGIGIFTGPAGTYHISIVEVPDGYNADDVGDLSVDGSTTSITVTVVKE